jgi:hypothetical protein
VHFLESEVLEEAECNGWTLINTQLGPNNKTSIYSFRKENDYMDFYIHTGNYLIYRTHSGARNIAGKAEDLSLFSDQNLTLNQ